MKQTVVLLSFFILIGCSKKLDYQPPPTPVIPAPVVQLNILMASQKVGTITAPKSWSTLPITNLIDGNLQTYFTTENSLITFSLQKNYLISQVAMEFFNPAKNTSYKFDLAVSQDSVTWVNVITNGLSDAKKYALETFTFTPTMGKYIRWTGNGNLGAYPKANSYNEFQVFGTDAITVPVDTIPMQFFSWKAPEINLVGRFIKDSGRVYAPGAYLLTTFMGPDAKVIVEDQKLWSAYNIVSYQVDNGPITRMKLLHKRDTLTVAQGLSDAPHTLRFVKDGEWVRGYLDFIGVIARALIPTPLSDHRIEWWGDSQFAGYGMDDSQVKCGTGHWSDQADAYLAFPAQTSRRLGAEYHLSALSGLGVIRSVDNTALHMIDVFDKLRWYDNQQPWDFTQWVAQLQVIELGQNDGAQDSTKFCSAYMNLIRQIYAKSGYSSQFLLLNGPMADGSFKVLMNKYLAGIKKQAESEGIVTTTFAFSKHYGLGCVSHPSKAESFAITDELTTFIQNYILW